MDMITILGFSTIAALMFGFYSGFLIGAWISGPKRDAKGRFTK